MSGRSEKVMNVFKKAYCKIFAWGAYLIKPLLPYHVPKTLEKIGDIPSLLKEQGKTTVMLVTDKSLRSLGVTADLENQLKQANINCLVYDNTRVNPTVDNVEEALKIYNDNNCQGLIAFGGGSSMDCAKGIGARLAKPKKTMYQMKGLLRVRGKIPLLIAIPTTAGTGSEATPAFVISDEKSGRKYTVNDFCLSPHYAVLDARVTYSLPPRLTATTGLDALSHALEGYVGRSSSKKTKAQSEEAIKLILDNVEIAYNDGNNHEARANMLKASYLGGMAMAMAYVGYVHAIAHTLGGKYNIPHGLTISIIMPTILEGYGKSVHKKLYKLAVHCGLAKKEDAYEVGANKFIARLRELNEKMGIPSTVDCIKREDIEEMAKYADKEANPLYPVPKLWGAKELEVFYEKIAGWRK